MIFEILPYFGFYYYFECAMSGIKYLPFKAFFSYSKTWSYKLVFTGHYISEKWTQEDNTNENYYIYCILKNGSNWNKSSYVIYHTINYYLCTNSQKS